MAPLLLLSGALPATLLAAGKPQERPNILWLTFEDTSPYELSCYGSQVNKTPVIDNLAKQGVQFMNAYSNGPQSSPSRSTIITGCYAPTYMMEWHRKKITTPPNIFFPQILREAGYYCTNNQKTDYNSRTDNTSCWDACNNNATYNSPDRKAGQPFFAVFNTMMTHMSRLTSVHLSGRRVSDFIAEGLDPAKLPLPPHVPDIEAVRSDYAFHMEGTSDVDRWVDIFLKDLKAHNLDQNTIVFVFSDHGGCLPRGKGFCYETSYRVPMVVYIPPKWQSMCKMKIGQQSDRKVAFVDLAPTVLSLAGIQPPARMQGMPFLGKYDTAERKYQYGLTGNQASHFTPIRTVSDGRWKYIRRYIPYKSDDLLNAFQWQMPSNLYWDKTYFEGKCTNKACELPFTRNEPELFYDLQNDPFEINNLIDDPKYAAQIDVLRKELSDHIRTTGDLGFAILSTRGKDECFYDKAHAAGYDLEGKYKLMELTATVTPKDVPMLVRNLNSTDLETKFWSVVCLAQLARKGGLPKAPAELVRVMLQSGDAQIVSEASYGLCYTDKRKEAFDFLATNRKNLLALEVLSMDKAMNSALPDKVKEMVRQIGLAPSKGVQTGEDDSGGPRIDARKIMVNWGELPAEQLYGDVNTDKALYNMGLKVNEARRPLVPTPEYNPDKLDQKPEQAPTPNKPKGKGGAKK